IHVWPLLFTPEARRARDRIVGFLRKVENGQGATAAAVAGGSSKAEPAEPDLVAAREGWPFSTALASIMSRFGAWQERLLPLLRRIARSRRAEPPDLDLRPAYLAVNASKRPVSRKNSKAARM